MADFTSDLQGSKPSFTFLDIDPNMELMSQLLEPSSNVNFQSYMGASDDNFFTQPIPEFPGNLGEIFPGVFQQDQKNVVPVSELNVSVASGNDLHESKKRKAMDLSESSSRNSSPSVSESWTIRRKCGSGGKGKGVKSSQEDKPKEVVHVRAKRGQATDSHSLAERVRRGKINERLRCLQDIVPGCYKTMGMAVMLDEIINYVQSLQNQVEFLSMKLTAASTFYDFNSETDAIDIMQRAKAFEAQKLQKAVKEGCEGVASSQHLPLDQNFGSYPSLPYNT